MRKIYSQRICRVLLLPFNKVLIALEDDGGWYQRTAIGTDGHHDRDILPVASFLLMLDSPSCRTNYLPVRRTLAGSECGLVTSIDVLRKKRPTIIPGVKDVLENLKVVPVCVFIDSPATKCLERVCSVSSDTVRVAFEKAIDPI